MEIKINADDKIRIGKEFPICVNVEAFDERKGLKENPTHKQWIAQVWANYHYGNMSVEQAIKLAGPEPAEFLQREITIEDVEETYDDFLVGTGRGL